MTKLGSVAHTKSQARENEDEIANAVRTMDKEYRMSKCSYAMFIGTLLLAGFSYAADLEEPPEPAAAIVNDERIPMSVLDKEIQTMMTMNPALRSSDNIDALRKMRKDILDDLINKELIIQEGKKADIKAHDIEIDTELAKIKQRFPSEDDFQAALKQQKFTEKALRNIIERALIAKKVLDIKVKPLAKAVTDEDIAVYYKENLKKFAKPEQAKASHILIKVDPDSDDKIKADAEAKSKIENILKQAKNGADFAELAKEHSQCPSGPQGGNLGYFGRGQMVKSFEDTSFALKEGQISEIVETQFGYHIILLVDKKPETQSELGEVEEEIRKTLHAKEVDAALESWLEPVRENANIKILFKG